MIRTASAVIAVLFLLTSITAYAKEKATDCSIYDAVYMPHPSHYLPGALPRRPHKLDFTLTLQRPAPGERGGSQRTIYIYIDAFDHYTKVHLSTIRLADSCSLGISVCTIGTHNGQYNSNEEMKDLRAGMAFEPVALDDDFFRVPFWGPAAPRVIILPSTASKIKYMQNPVDEFETDSKQFIRFFTNEKIWPDFSGYDTWLLSTCKNTKSTL